MLGGCIGAIVGGAVAINERLFSSTKFKLKTPSWLRLPNFNGFNFIILHCMYAHAFKRAV